MIDSRVSSRGQVLIIFVFVIIGLIGITGLAVDGGNIFSERRHAQNAADTAALAGAIARDNWVALNGGSTCNGFNTSTGKLPKNGCDAVLKALDVAGENGYANGSGVNNARVDVYSPPIDGYYQTCSNGDCDPNNYIEVVISSDVNTFFAKVLGIGQTHNKVEAVALGSAYHKSSPFPGEAIVGLDPNGLSFQAQSNAQKWTIAGGGIFVNHNAVDTHSTVTFTDGHCVTAVGLASGFTCGGSSNNPLLELKYPTDVAKLLPDIPTCDGQAYYDKTDGKVHPDKKAALAATGSKWNPFDAQYAPGLYCITGPNAGGNIHDTVGGTDVTFYILDPTFTVKYNGGGMFQATAPTSGTYAGVLMFSSVMTPTGGSCPQNVEFRGNGNMPVVGTIFMPGACINWLGNSTGIADNTMLVGWQIYSNGSANANFLYDENANYKHTFPGQVGLMH